MMSRSSSVPSAVSRAPACSKYLRLASLALERLHGGLVEPVGEEDAAVRGRQRVRLPLLEVVLVVEPLIEQLPKVDFDLAPHAAINRLHLVGLVGRHLVVVDANRLYQRRDLHLGE